MNKKIDSLQTIRALAFLGIFASHSEISVFAAHGAWGVSVFFILSGFLMFLSYGGTERITEYGIKYSVKFGVNKIKPLYPLHIVTLFFALPDLMKEYMGDATVHGLINPILKTVLNITLLQSWIPRSRIYFSLNSVSWYLSTSLFLYIMFPLALMLMKKYRGGKDAIIVIITVFIIQLVLGYGSYNVQKTLIHDKDFVHWFVYIFPLSRLEDFIIGCNVGYLFKYCKRDKKISRSTATICEILVGIVLVVLWGIYLINITIPEDYNNYWWGLTLLYTLSSCVLVYVFALNKGIISSLLTNKIFVFIGYISANGFLIHQMVFRYMSSIIEKHTFITVNKYLNIIICLFLTIIFSLMWSKLSEYVSVKFDKIKQIDL